MSGFRGVVPRHQGDGSWGTVRGFVGLLMVLLMTSAVAQDSAWRSEQEAITYSVDSSADGSVVVAGRRDNTVAAFDGAGEPLWEFRTEGSVYGVAVADDGQAFAAASEDRNVYFLDATGGEVWRYRGSQTFTSVALSADGSVLAAASEDRNVYVFNREGTLLWQYDVGDTPTAVAVIGSGAGGADTFEVFLGSDRARVLRLNSQGEPLWESNLRYATSSLDVTADGARVLVGDEDGLVYLLDGENGETLWEVPVDGEVSAVAMSEDGAAAVAATEEGGVYALREDGSVASEGAQDAQVYSLALSEDGGVLVVGRADQLAYLVRSGEGYAFEQRASLAPWLVLAAVGIVALLGALVGLRRLQIKRRQASTGQTPPRGLGYQLWQSRMLYLFLLPTFIMLAVFNYYPAFSGIYHAFTEWTPGAETRWTGLENFRAMWQNRYLWSGTGNLVLLIVTAVLKLALPLLVAELIFHLRNGALRYFMRTAFIVQVIVPGVVGILLWVNIYDPNIGLANQTLRALGLEDLTRVWLGEEGTALGSIIFMGFPWVGALALLIFYGGLIGIPGDIFDAAKMDGVTTLRRIWSIDLPLLKGQLRLLLILTFIATVQEFTVVLLTTGGGPGSATYLPALEMYYQAVRFNNFGLASAIGSVLFLVILGGTILNLRYVKSSVEYTA